MPETIDSIRRSQQGLPNPLSREIPGQSLTREPGEYAFEQPARINNPVEAVDTIFEKIKEPNNLTSLLNLLDAGVSIESIVRTITFTAFTDGMITVDTAELVNPILILEILALARKGGIGDPRILNSYPEESVTVDKSLEIMKQLKPKKYKTILENAQALKEDKMISREDRLSAMAGSFMSDVSSPRMAAPPMLEAQPGFLDEQPPLEQAALPEEYPVLEEAALPEETILPEEEELV